MITVIIPTYNRREVLKDVLPSYLRQKYVERIILVDDGSTDDTKGMIKTLAEKEDRINYICLLKRKGAPAAKNAAINYLTSNYVLIGEDDVELDDSYAENLLKCLNEKKVSGVAGRIIYIGEKEKKLDALERVDKLGGNIIDAKNITSDFQLKRDKPIQVPFFHAVALFRSSVFNKYRYDENYIKNSYREETDFALQLSKNGHKLFFCPSAVCYHLPRKKVSFGGQREMNRLFYEIFTVINNARFLRKHYNYLRKELDINHTRFVQNLIFGTNRIKKQVGYLIKLIR